MHLCFVYGRVKSDLLTVIVVVGSVYVPLLWALGFYNVFVLFLIILSFHHQVIPLVFLQGQGAIYCLLLNNILMNLNSIIQNNCFKYILK
jgi:hypothetical protein